MKKIIRFVISIENRIINRIPNLFWLLRMFRGLEYFCCTFAGLQVVECVGDSHLGQIRLLSLEPEMRSRRLWFRSISVNGATALGIKNPNSKTNAMYIFDYWKRFFRSDSYILFMLGEVDCGFLVWFLAGERSQSVDDLFFKAFDNYIQFIDSVSASAGHKIIVSAPLPTIKDGVYLGEIANLRKSISVSQKERTNLTIKFNDELRNWTTKKSIKYVGLDDLVLNIETGIIQEKYLNRDKRNHHYDLSSFIRLLASQLSKNIFPKFPNGEDAFD